MVACIAWFACIHWLSPSGTDFARLIVCSPHNKFGIERISLLNGERGIFVEEPLESGPCT